MLLKVEEVTSPLVDECTPEENDELSKISPRVRKILLAQPLNQLRRVKFKIQKSRLQEVTNG